jgi:hypothetical protein
MTKVIDSVCHNGIAMKRTVSVEQGPTVTDDGELAYEVTELT